MGFRDEQGTNIPILLVFESVFGGPAMGTDNEYAPIAGPPKTNPNPAQYRYICALLIPLCFDKLIGSLQDHGGRYCFEGSTIPYEGPAYDRLPALAYPTHAP
jgi:hypothetical protein